MGHKPAGGIKSNKVTHQGVRTGAPRHGVNPRWTSQVGQSYGNHATERVGMMPTEKVIERYDAGRGISVPPGNEVAASTKCGPGGSRTIYRTGTQSQHGPVAGNSKPQGRDILREYGPDYKR